MIFFQEGSILPCPVQFFWSWNMNLKGNRENYHHNTFFFGFFTGHTKKFADPKSRNAIPFPTPTGAYRGLQPKVWKVVSKMFYWNTPKPLGRFFTQFDGVLHVGWAKKKPPTQAAAKTSGPGLCQRGPWELPVGLAGWSLEGTRTSPNFAKLGRTSHEAMPSCIDLEDSLALVLGGCCWPSKKGRIGRFSVFLAIKHSLVFQHGIIGKETHRNIFIGGKLGSR